MGEHSPILEKLGEPDSHLLSLEITAQAFGQCVHGFKLDSPFLSLESRVQAWVWLLVVHSLASQGLGVGPALTAGLASLWGLHG